MAKHWCDNIKIKLIFPRNMVKSLLHSSTMSDVYLLDSGEIEKHRGSRPGSETILEREFSVLSQLNMERIPEVRGFEETAKILTMSRVGTHDLSDVLHDVPLFTVPYIMRDFFSDLSTIHGRGFVHRDIKPGNVMFNVGPHGVINYAGIVDFGMSLISNRKQNEPLAIGGTEPYTHPTQSSKKFKELRTQPGQDWFAAGRTMAHLLSGGSTTSFESLLNKDRGAGLLTDLKLRFRAAFQSAADECQPVLKLMLFALSQEASGEDALMELLELGMAATECLRENITGPWPHERGPTSFQSGSSERPKRHDVLLIVDNTGSMAPYVQQVKDAFDEIANLVRGLIDLRVDLWSLGDYSTGEGGQQAVVPLGQRMRADTFQESMKSMDASRGQYDEAEAYEVALQRAYLHHPKQFWSPRQSTRRSIVLVGDAYAHGWLEKFSPWGAIVSKARGRWDKNAGVRREPDPKIKSMYDDFCRRHPHYMTLEIQNAERDAYKEAFVEIERRDSTRRTTDSSHVIVENELFKHRPNYKTALEKCVGQKHSTIHTIGSGSNLVSSSFLKYVALYGKGTYTHVGNGELIIALKGIFASVDAKIFREFEKETMEHNPNTQALNSITTFVIDSMSDEDD